MGDILPNRSLKEKGFSCTRQKKLFALVFTKYGAVPEWPKGEACKALIHRFESDRHLNNLIFLNYCTRRAFLMSSLHFAKETL